MQAFQHLSVLVSIVVGMAVSQLIFGLGQLVRRRGSARIDPLYIPSNAIVLLILVDSWWSTFSWSNVPGWSGRLSDGLLCPGIVVCRGRVRTGTHDPRHLPRRNPAGPALVRI